MPNTSLGTSILENGIRSVNFFNGRLLTGEDLSQEQTANRAAHQYLGQAIGEGVAYGLEVYETLGSSAPATPIVTVEPGLAINRRGHSLHLPHRVDVALASTAGSTTTPTSVAQAGFANCEPSSGSFQTTGAGVYLLTILAATGSEGRAPVSGLGNVAATCNTSYQVEGVQFRRLRLDVSASDLNDANRLRNRLAYRCFGTDSDAMTDFYTNPFGPPLRHYGLLDTLRPDCLTDDEVPLAIFYWTTSGGLRFVDRWAVRRRVTPMSANERTILETSDSRLMRAATNERWRLLTTSRRECEAEAIFLQFQEQIEELRVASPNTLQTIVATDRFDYLPPMGFLPIIAPGSPGLDVGAFFGTRASNDVALLDANQLRDLQHEARFHEPIDLNDPGKIQLYQVYEHLVALEQGETVQPFVVFASSSLPYRGTARYGNARYGLSRFASQVL